MQSIDPIMSRTPNNRLRKIDPGPPPSPRSSGRAIDGFVRPVTKVAHAAVNQPKPRVYEHAQRRTLAPQAAKLASKPAPKPALNEAGRKAYKAHPAANAFSKPRQAAATLKKAKPWGGRWSKILFGFGVAGLAGLGLVPYIGEGVLLLYAIAVLVFKIESRVTFGLAVAGLVFVALSQLGGLPELAEHYAVYSYLLLFIGTLSLALEARRGKRQIKSLKTSAGIGE